MSFLIVIMFSFPQCLYVNKSLNSICSSFKAIVSVQKSLTKQVNSNGLVLQSHELLVLQV